MKIFIAGNMGYVGPGVLSQLRKTYPEAELVGFDTGFFANNLTNT
jgi:UDP-N-acetyl-D-mannosaminuronic acid transferase (WecB/TagA/CpsF family)